MLDGILGRGFTAKWFTLCAMFSSLFLLFDEESVERFEIVVTLLITTNVLSSAAFCFQQIVDQIDEQANRCDTEEEKSDREVSEERYC